MASSRGLAGTISEKDDTLICSQSRRLERWAEHFREQFSWPSATLQLPSIPRQCEWNIEVGPTTLAEVQKAIVNLKRGKAAGPDGLAAEVFKDGCRSSSCSEPDGMSLYITTSELATFMNPVSILLC
ncbi:unnamed protein product [Schistosoma curassoni]|uniref:Reverse transcriptase domain-containing protein n=1 Tax=Schistosoma curassoni TaxID=6186 RepID=A0A183L7K6_9TREM|nr:unnamed protein product [Schistosoma curassoni]